MQSTANTSRSRPRIGRALVAVAIGATALVGAGRPSLVTADATTAAEPVAVDAAAATLERGSDFLAGAASAYRAINPVRVLDTRFDDGIARMWIESAISIDPVTDTGVADAAGVDPADITAVVVNVTMINAGDAGFGSMWPTGSSRLLTSTNNTEFEGHTIPNLVIAPLGLERKISFYASATSHVAVDVLGVFVESGATSAGRFVALGPERAFDTRAAGIAEFSANETREVDLTSIGVPTSATGVVMNVTAIRSRGAGFYRVWSFGDPPPSHSSVNVLGVDYQAGNQVISGVRDGKVNVFTNVGGGLTIDVTGYFTGSADDVSTEGLYVPFTPGRFLDSRASTGPTAATDGARLSGGAHLDLNVSDRLDIPAGDAKAVAFNLTAVRADDRGFVKAFPGGSSKPRTSALNFTAGGQTVPNHAITSVASDGAVTVIASQDTHLLMDATGYFLAAGATPPVGGAAVTRVVDPGSLVPDALPTVAPTDGPYDYLFDRGSFLARGQRPSPTIAASWPTCAPIRYALNVDLAENDAQVAVLIDSIEEIEMHTGLDFQYAGATSAGMNIDDEILLPEGFRPVPPYKYLPPDSNGAPSVSLVIGFSNNADTIELRNPGVIGVGGSLRAGQDASGRAVAQRGFALIDLVELYDDGPEGPSTLGRIKATTTHELGHMMGLGHVSDFDPRSGAGSTLFQGLGPKAGTWDDGEVQDQLMYPSLNPAASVDFDLGDQRGLHELYASTFCPPGSGPLNDNKPGGNTDDIDWSTVEVVKPVDDFG